MSGTNLSSSGRPPAPYAAWICVFSERDMRDALRHSTRYGRDQFMHDGEPGSEVSLCCFRQDQPVQRKIRNGPAQSLVFLLKGFQFLQLICGHFTVRLLPAIERLFSHANLAERTQTRHPLPCHNLNLPSLRGNLFRIWSLAGHVFPPFSKHGRGPLHWGRIRAAYQYPQIGLALGQRADLAPGSRTRGMFD
jgi:hypothetical protein